jgi:hypothetical protein
VLEVRLDAVRVPMRLAQSCGISPHVTGAWAHSGHCAHVDINNTVGRNSNSKIANAARKMANARLEAFEARPDRSRPRLHAHSTLQRHHILNWQSGLQIDLQAIVRPTHSPTTSNFFCSFLLRSSTKIIRDFFAQRTGGRLKTHAPVRT